MGHALCDQPDPRRCSPMGYQDRESILDLEPSHRFSVQPELVIKNAQL